MADRISLPPTPPGLQDQMYRGDGGPQRMPTPPRQANTLVVGGPAYFTPEGYQAPIQPTQSFMPTNRAPDPIRDQFNRQLPPIQRPQPPMPAPQPQMPDPRDLPPPYLHSPEGDGSFQDINTELPTQTGGVGDPAPYVPPVPTPTPAPAPAPSQGPDRGSASPTYTPPPPPPPPEPKTEYEIAMENYSPTGMTNEQLKISMDAGLPIPKADYPDFEAYLASLSAPVSAPEPDFVPPPTMPEPNGFFPGVTPDFSNLDFGGLSDVNLEAIDFSNLKNTLQQASLFGDDPRPAPVSPPAVATMPAPAPAPVYTPPPSQVPMQDMFDDFDYGNPNLRNMGRSGPRR